MSAKNHVRYVLFRLDIKRWVSKKQSSEKYLSSSCSARRYVQMKKYTFDYYLLTVRFSKSIFTKTNLCKNANQVDKLSSTLL